MDLFGIYLIGALAVVAWLIVKRVQYARAGTTSLRRAKRIMGRHIFTPDDAFLYVGAPLPETARRMLKRVSFNEATLRHCKDTHLLVAVLPISINEIRAKAERRHFSDNNWYADLAFAKDEGLAGWHLVRKSSLPKSVWLPLGGQLGLLTEREALPSARVMVFTIIGFREKQGDHLFDAEFVRCADREGNYCISVGNFEHYRGNALELQRELEIQKQWESYVSGNLGIAPERLSDRDAA